MTDPTVPPSPEQTGDEEKQHADHWHGSNRIVIGILTVWFLVSLGASVLFRDFLDATLPMIGGAPFGFWMAQQGAIISFVLLLVIYRSLMNRLDHKHGLEDQV
jgi:putative solute:sodium symporter small subunit